MKIHRHWVALTAVLVIYLLGLYFWTLPIRTSPFPYGEADASSHFGVSNVMAQTDRPLMKLPSFVDWTYRFDNKFRNGVLWYPPPLQVNMALAQIMVPSSPVFAYFLIIAMLCLLGVFSVFFLAYRFFGIFPAILSSLMLVFSRRDVMTFLWGQYPQIIGFTFTPVYLYFIYSYARSFLEEKPDLRQGIFAVLLLIAAYYFHPQTLFYHLLITFIFAVLVVIRKPSLFGALFSHKRHILILLSMLLLLLLLFPLQSGNVFIQFLSQTTADTPVEKWPSLLAWYDTPANPPSVPGFYFKFSGSHPLPALLAMFSVLGVIILLIKRGLKELLFLAWLVAFYLAIHQGWFGLGRGYRFLPAEAYLIYPLSAFGFFAIANMFGQLIRSKMAAAVTKFVFLLAAIVMLVPAVSPTIDQLGSAYTGVLRITAPQSDALLWVKENLPADANVLGLGIFSIAKEFWHDAISWRHFYHPENVVRPERERNAKDLLTHVWIDYSDWRAIGRQDIIAQLESIEAQVSQNATLLYDRGGVKIYELKR